MSGTEASTPARAVPVRALRLVLALAVALVLGMIPAPAALALGEQGPFDLPLARESVTIAPGVVNRIPVASLLEDSAEPHLQTDTVRLAIPSGATDAQLSAMTLTSDGTSLSIDGEGTWSILGEDIVFTPDSQAETSQAPIAITVEANNGVRSLPSDLPVKEAPVTEVDQKAPAGTEVTIPISGKSRPEGTARIHLLLDSLPASSTLSGDARRVVVPDEGTWQLSEDSTSLTFSPSSGHLGRSPDSLRYVATADDGTILGTGIVNLTTPVLPDLVRAEPYGDPVDFSLSDGQRGVDPDTLRLVPLDDADAVAPSSGDAASDGSAGDAGSGDAGSDASGTGTGTGRDSATSTLTEVTDDGTRAVVPGQGTWTLDRKDQTVRFTPADGKVTAADPVGVTGEDADGNGAGVAQLTVGYPAMLAQTQVEPAGTTASFSPLDHARFVRSDSLRFLEADLPAGSKLSENARSLTIPGQGTWTIELDSRSVTFVPDSHAGAGIRSHVRLQGQGSYADAAVDAELTAVVSDHGAVLRDDELRTAPGRAVQVDLLANDTAGDSTDPLTTSSVRISSLNAANLDQLSRYTGNHLVVPGEGEYTVGSDGVLTFDPARGFRGRASAISYTVQDADGIMHRANVVAHVDPELAGASDPRGDSSAGINTMLSGLMPSAASTSAVFITIVVLLGFSGGVSLFIGARMESDRRTWKD